MTAGNEEKIARRYAKALFEATAPTDFDAAISQLEQLASLWDSSADFRQMTINPRITDSVRSSCLEAVVASIGGWKIEPVKRVAHLLVAGRKAAVLPSLLTIFSAFVSEYRKSLTLEITTARALQDGELSQMKQKLSSVLGGEVKLEAQTDPSLIGGITIRVGDRYLDRSISGTLNRLATQLA